MTIIGVERIRFSLMTMKTKRYLVLYRIILQEIGDTACTIFRYYLPWLLYFAFIGGVGVIMLWAVKVDLLAFFKTSLLQIFFMSGTAIMLGIPSGLYSARVLHSIERIKPIVPIITLRIVSIFVAISLVSLYLFSLLIGIYKAAVMLFFIGGTLATMMLTITVTAIVVICVRRYL